MVRYETSREREILGRRLKQGDIIKVDLDPTVGHEQAGYRPVVVVSNDFFNKKSNTVMICPITNTTNKFPLHVELDGTQTTGEVKCEHIRAIDIANRPYKFIESITSEDVIKDIADIIYGSTEVLED